jgi:hypothetical protein
MSQPHVAAGILLLNRQVHRKATSTLSTSVGRDQTEEQGSRLTSRTSVSPWISKRSHIRQPGFFFLPRPGRSICDMLLTVRAMLGGACTGGAPPLNRALNIVSFWGVTLLSPQLGCYEGCT